MIAWWARVEIAMLFFALAFMVLLKQYDNKIKKRILFIIFMLMLPFSHYSTAYITFIILTLVILILWFQKIIYKRSTEKSITWIFTILFFTVIFFWYGQLTDSIDSAVDFTKNTIINLNNFFLKESRSAETSKILGETGILPEKISYGIHTITFILIGIGVISLIKKAKFSLNTYISITLACFIILVAVEFLPYVSKGYDSVRTYQLALVLLSPVFVIGGITISRFLRQNSTGIIILVMLLQFMSANLLFYQLAGIPYSMLYNSEGLQYDQEYIYPQDIDALQWLKNSHAYFVCADSSDVRNKWVRNFGSISYTKNCFAANKTTGEKYIFFKYRNVIGKVQIVPGNNTDISQYSHLFINKNKIYNNGGSEIYQ